MNQKDLFVSVVIPVHNGELFLEEALESAMRQRHARLEVIVIDDGSTDATSKIVRDFGSDVRYVWQPKSGAAVARNRGIEMARGEVIAFLDADDVWPDNKLKIQLAYFEKDPELQVVFGRVQFMVASWSGAERPVFEKLGRPSVGVNVGSALFRKTIFDKFGLFDQSLAPSEDVDFFMRIRESGTAIIVAEEVALFYRLHDRNLISDKNMRNTAFIRALKKSMDRRKMQGIEIAKLRIEK